MAEEGTAWQLTCLSKIDEVGDWAAASASLGVSRQVMQKAIKRLAEKLGSKDAPAVLVKEVDGQPVVVNKEALDVCNRILEGYRELSRVANERVYFVRLNGFWSYLQYLAPAAREFEAFMAARDIPVRVELVNDFGRRRSGGGEGLIQELTGFVDVVVAPRPVTARSPLAPGVKGQLLYRTALAAAITAAHPAASGLEPKPTTIPVSRLAAEREPNVALATSPSGHLSRDTLEKLQTPARTFDFEVSSPEPAALVAMGSDRIVPIVSSDSFIAWNPRWLALEETVGRTNRRPVLVGWDTFVYYRTAGLPGVLSETITEFAAMIYRHAQPLRERVAKWDHLQTFAARPVR